jgi:hypothetical protein
MNELTDLFNDKVVTAKTKVWAQGLDGWRLLQQVRSQNAFFKACLFQNF